MLLFYGLVAKGAEDAAVTHSDDPTTGKAFDVFMSTMLVAPVIAGGFLCAYIELSPIICHWQVGRHRSLSHLALPPLLPPSSPPSAH